MFKIGDKVKIVKVGTRPIEDSDYDEYLGREGEIKLITSSYTYFLVYFGKEGDDLWFKSEHMEPL